MTPRFLYPAAAACLVAAYQVLPEFVVVMFCYVGLYALVALGLVMLTGIGGMTSFGQAAFVGLGAYATAVVCTAPQFGAALNLGPDSAWLPWIGLLTGMGLTVTLAYLLGRLTTNLAGHYLPLCTIAWGMSLYMLFGNLELLGGHTGIGGLPAIRIGSVSLISPRLLGAVTWLSVLGTIWALANLLDSREGRSIRSLKSSRVMAESMGVDTGRQRLRIFVLAAALACVSGWLYAHLQRFVNPTPFSLNIGVEYLFMTVVGGVGHLWGAVLGAALVVFAKQYLQDILPGLLGASGNFEMIAFGCLMLLVLQRYPEGSWRAFAGLSPRWMKRRAHALPVPASAHVRAAGTRGSVVLRGGSLTRKFGGLVANDSVSLELKAGEIHALIGPNGAGKSTLFDLLSGVAEPDAGGVELMGHSMAGQPARAFAAAGLARTFQHVHLLGDRSVLENVALGGHLRGTRGWVAAAFRRDRAEESALLADALLQMKRCGLDMTDTPALALSLGQQRLVEIARALTAHPLVLLLDEPAAGLRRQEKVALAKLLSNLRDEGMSILIVEHDMDFVMNLADTVTVLNFGQVIARGQPEEVQRNQDVRDAYLGTATESAP